MQSHSFPRAKEEVEDEWQKAPGAVSQTRNQEGRVENWSNRRGEVARKGGDGDAFKGSGRQSKERKGGGENAEQ